MPTENFLPVVDFHVAFAPHSSYPDVITDMNTRYSSNLYDPGAFFTDNLRTNVRSTTEINALIKERIIGHLIAPDAYDDAEISDIRNALKASPIKVGSPITGTFRRLNQGNLLLALRESIEHRCPTINFQIDVLHLKFVTADSPGLNFLTWTHSEPLGSHPADTPAPSSPPPVSPTAISANDIANAITAGVSAMNLHTPPPLTAADIAAAVTAGVTALNLSTPQVSATNTAPPAPAPVPASSTATASLFNHRTLPPDVLARYLDKLNDQPILGSTTRTPFAAGYLHHFEVPDKIILADGTIFIMHTTPNEKELLKANISCDDTTFAGIRSWYSRLVRCCMDYGFYIHPLWNFRPDRGERGFTTGPLPDDDLPPIMELKIINMSQPIYRLLSRPTMFPKDSTIPSIITSSDGDGYKALKLILLHSHPVFHDQPEIMITTYPRQRNLTVLQYAQLMRDYLQLRAYISDHAATLDDPSEVNIFINNLRHSAYVNRVTRDERRQTAFAHKYKGSQLIETIMKKLLAPDSPALHDSVIPMGPHDRLVAPTTPPPPKYVYASNKPKPYPRRPQQLAPSTPVHHLRSDLNPLLPDDYTVHSQHSRTMDPQQHAHSPTTGIVASLHSIKVPPNTTDLALYHQYCASVHRIQADPAKNDSPTCLVCSGTHRFDSCPVLSNTEFLRSHYYIRYCQQLKRDSAARTHTFPSLTTARQVNLLDYLSDEASDAPGGLDLVTSDPDEDPDAPDFQLGRV